MKVPLLKDVDNWSGEVQHPGHARECQNHYKITFESTKELTSFINNGCRFFCYDMNSNRYSSIKTPRIQYFEINKVIRSRQLWMIVNAIPTTLREINLEILTT